jgi:NADH-quinone oxidoreductase subunit E
VFQVCAHVPCALGGSEKVFDHLASDLGIGKDGTTPDGLFTLKKVECLANCDQAPCLQINEDFVDRVTPAACDGLVIAIRAFQAAANGPERPVPPARAAVPPPAEPPHEPCS